MWLKSIKILQFKNYNEGNFEFIQGVNVFTGNNGVGKTTVLDAIHYLCMCKSYFNPIDSQQIKSDLDFFMIQGVFEKENIDYDLTCSMKKNQKKVFKKNKKEYSKLSEHIGQFPLVMISPYDANLILEGSEVRRKFLDTIISQTDKGYLDNLIAYNKHLTARNILLKQSRSNAIDVTLLTVYDEQLIYFGQAIYDKRAKFMEEFLPLFNLHYLNLTDAAERVSLAYISPLQNRNFAQILLENLNKDKMMERTTSGIHKDDLEFLIHEMSLKKFGSQGQQKSFLIALKLAQYSYIQKYKKVKPLLLLDDIFEKLDQLRVEKLMQMVAEHHFGQIFITDTDAQRVIAIFDRIDEGIKQFQIESGGVYA